VEAPGHPPPAPGLPPEVEAELRRRALEQSAGSGYPPSAPAPKPENGGWKKKLGALGPIGALLLLVFGKAKYLAVIGKFALPVLKTGGTMLVSMWFYAVQGGWPFAAGFVITILIHELGHVYAAWRVGIPVSAPIFIPMFGAMILQKQIPKSTWEQALIGIGGPAAGTLAGVACLGLFHLTGNPFWQRLAAVTFFLNLFNMMPVIPLDGGWITGAVSPRLWLVGTVLLLVMAVTGFLNSPFIWILLLLSLPRLWHGLKTGDVTPEGGTPTTPDQRIRMGVAYVGLAGLLLWLLTLSFTRGGPV
jgi:Zn-dependent protease